MKSVLSTLFPASKGWVCKACRKKSDSEELGVGLFLAGFIQAYLRRNLF